MSHVFVARDKALGRGDEAVRSLEVAHRLGHSVDAWRLTVEGFEDLRGYPPLVALIAPAD